jgi:gamma-glutamylcyclotransferase (GGCT)/AIG2-like uncharacterized protein YtfP
MNALFVYGTLRPGHSNAHILKTSAVNGWPVSSPVRSTNAAGARRRTFPDCPPPDGPRVEGYLFISDNLSAHWQMLDEFEDGYDRVEVTVTTSEGKQVQAWIYQLQPRSES